MGAAKELAVENRESEAERCRCGSNEGLASDLDLSHGPSPVTPLLTRALSVTCDRHRLVRASPASSANSARPLPLERPYPQNAMENEIDGWIAQLSQCKQLSESDVKRLCDMVRARSHFSDDNSGSPPGLSCEPLLAPVCARCSAHANTLHLRHRRGRSLWSSQTYSL